MKNFKRIDQAFILLATAPVHADIGANANPDYLIGGIIAFLILCYLVYSLVKPEKF